jgi:hypothetical protein
VTETAPDAIEPTPTTRSRRPMILGLAFGVLAVIAVGVGVWFAVGGLGSKAYGEYTSEAEHYSVTVPGEPSREEGLAAGLIPTTATHWADGDVFFSVTSTDLTGGTISPAMRGQFLHDVLVAALADAPGVSAASLESDAVENAFLAQPEEIMLDGAPAFRFSLDIEGAPTPFQVVFAGHEPIVFLLVYSDTTDSRGQEFLDSFAFVD